MERRFSLLAQAIIVAVATLTGCKSYDPLFCDENNPCTDPARPFCDLRGEYPESEGIGKTCIAEPPDLEADAGGDAKGPDGGAQADAAPRRRVVYPSIGKDRTCAVLDDGGLRCWGSNASGALGYPLDVTAVGDDEHPFELGDVPTGAPIKQVALAGSYTCVLYQEGNVRCFGSNSGGNLGYGHTEPVPGPPSDVPDVSLDEPARTIAAGLYHVCAVLESGAVRCWGTSGFNALGYGDDESTVGDDEVPSSNPPIDIGGPASVVTTGVLHTCAIMAGAEGRVRCWGAGLLGLLGYGNTLTIGDNEAPSTAGNVSVGGPAVDIQAYEEGNCVLLQSGDARCWGEGDYGDNEPASVAPLLALGGAPQNFAGGPRCALATEGSARCWGRNDSGELGLGHRETVNPGQILTAGPAVLGGPAEKLARGFVGLIDAHMCALLEEGAVRCWGNNEAGQLGLGHRENVGDDELPTDEPAVRVLD